jgi:Zn finger protein HypA/HybF involved in hydrogenase expression
MRRRLHFCSVNDIFLSDNSGKGEAMKTNQTFICPNCGGEVRKGSASCPHCGSDERTGWGKETYLDGIDTDDDFDYNDLLEQEFPAFSPKKAKRSWVVIVATILLVLSAIGLIKILL